jgi:transposase
MPGPGLPLRGDYDAETCRRLAAGSKDVRQARRLLSLAAAYDGMSRADAARIGGMDRQTLRDWVVRFNVDGPDGLCDLSRSGRPCLLDADQLQHLARIVETGPDIETDGVVRWRRIDLCRVIKERFGVDYAERSISTLLAGLGFARISGRPHHPGQDSEILETFKKTSPKLLPMPPGICPET